MTFFGKSLPEYVSFEKEILGFIVIVGLGRLILSLAGTPNARTKFVSITVATLLGWLYVAYKVNKHQFGSYKPLLPLVAIQSLTASVIIAGSVALAILTNRDNIYSAPEYSFGVDGKTWGHAGAHLFIATIFLSLAGWAIGSLALFIARKISHRGQGTPAQTEGRGKSAAASAK